MPGRRSAPGPSTIEDPDDTDLDDAAAQELVAEAFHTFGEEMARTLAYRLGVGFEACAEAITRLGRLHG